MILVIDNYDSFTYNLVQCLGALGADLHVVRNDGFTLEEVEQLQPAGIIISPGPGGPEETGLSIKVLQRFATTTPILGVCLGHQCIGHFFGARIIRAPESVHGKTEQIFHHGDGLYEGLPNPFIATRYHSLIVERESLPAELEITAENATGLIMGLRHRTYPVEGVQFHPESVLSVDGPALLGNFLRRCR